MTVNKKRNEIQPNKRLSLQVMDDLTVQLYTNPKFDFLMDTETVANGYGVVSSTINSNKFNHKDELVKGKHWVTASAVQILDGEMKVPHNKVFWTKAGIIRLGFFIKSERAKAFRDWAESVILEVTAPPAQLPPVKKRNHNRLTANRLLNIMVDVAKIDDKEVRLSLMQKLGL